LGATVIVPATTLPDGDVMAILLDPAGLTFGVVRTPRSNAS
jgi:predicted enzyme related to lactoylglutathione lyase